MENKDIIKRYESGDTALFKWCQEYKDWVSENVHCNVTMEWEYILKQSFEDGDAPFSYDDYDHFYYDEDELISAILDDFEAIENIEDKETFIDDMGVTLQNKTLKEHMKENFDVEDLKDIIENKIDHLITFDLDKYERTKEIFQWFMVSSHFQDCVERVDDDQAFLNGAWGRQCYGQSITLDHVVIEAFIKWIRE